MTNHLDKRMWRRLDQRSSRAPLGGMGVKGLLSVVVAMLFSSVASATPPASVIGSWTILVDQTYTTLEITNQGASGSPGGSACRVILGSVGVSPMNGTYCPETGRIHFLQRNPSTNVVVRTYTGSVSAATAELPAHIAGTTDVLNIGLGKFGESPFSGSKL